MILQLCCQVIEANGLVVLQATDGSEAIHIAGHYGGTIDLLLSDVVMPGTFDGVRLAETLTASRPAMKVLLMSGSSDEGLCHHADWQFIWKPFPIATLEAKIEESL